MTSEDYPYLAQLSLPDRLRLAAYEARGHGVAAIYLRVILDAAEELKRQRWLTDEPGEKSWTSRL